DIVTVPNGKPNIITPGGNILQGQNLLFQWDKIEGVKKYVLYIQNDGNQEIWKTEITDNKYNFTDKDFPLKRSIPYKLIVVTDSNNGYKEASAKFIILNEAKATKIKAEIDYEQDLIKKVGIYQNYDLYSEPIELLEKQKTKSYDIYVNLADCYYLLGRIDKAKENYEYALQLPTNTAEQKELLQKEIQKLQELIDKNKKSL
ncbi:MAG TPA: tetratricopeptide repeat protein, partial [Allocoleopsis sp.]